MKRHEIWVAETKNDRAVSNKAEMKRYKDEIFILARDLDEIQL